MGVKFCALGSLKIIFKYDTKSTRNKKKNILDKFGYKNLKFYVFQRVTSRKQKDNKQN